MNLPKKTHTMKLSYNTGQPDLLGPGLDNFRSRNRHFLAYFSYFFPREVAPAWDNPYDTISAEEACNPTKKPNFKANILSDEWDPAQAVQKLKELGHVQVSDALMDPEIFTGLNNEIKNEILFQLKIHPQSHVGALPTQKIRELVKAARNLSLDFRQWKRNFEHKRHRMVYKQKSCPGCQTTIHKTHQGRTGKLNCFCSHCQELYTTPLP